MKPDEQVATSRALSNKLFWTGVVTSLVGLKLLFSFFIPGLKTPGELLLSGFLLLVCAVQLFLLYSSVRQPETRENPR
jgi:hypothetical protein